MLKWARSAGPARQPAKERVGRVEVSSTPTRCNPTCQSSGPARPGPSTRFFFFFYIKKKKKYIYKYIYIYNKFKKKIYKKLKKFKKIKKIKKKKDRPARRPASAP